MFKIIEKMFIVLLSNIFNGSNCAKCVLLRKEKYVTQPAIINLHPNEYSQEFQYYPFLVKLDRYVRSCNTLNDLSNKVFIPNKTEHLNLSVFSVITGKNELKKLTKHHANVNLSLMEDSVIQINGGITINADVSVKTSCM